MRLEPSDPDIETIVTRIGRGDIDLQPAFQRGEVWSQAKKQRLVDSILRDWHIPPIHVIELRETRKQEVLDGQQRLVAIRDFAKNELPIDGTIEPHNAEIAALDGKKFSELTDEWKRRFNQFTLRIFRIVDYASEEPGELFFRLNQPLTLTAAEQRNAFFGPMRTQVKDLVFEMELLGIDRDVLGFSNSRMAYDDVVARVALIVERDSMHEKVTATDLVHRYRSTVPLSDRTIEKVRGAIQLIGNAAPEISGKIQFNKATLQSWMIFAIVCSAHSKQKFTHGVFSSFVSWFEFQRLLLSSSDGGQMQLQVADSERLLYAYNNRASARVSDVSSVVLRDVAIWSQFASFVQQFDSELFELNQKRFTPIAEVLLEVGVLYEEDTFAREMLEHGWGRPL